MNDKVAQAYLFLNLGGTLDLCNKDSRGEDKPMVLSFTF